MAKSPAYDLTDAEKRDLIQLLQAGRALPDKYRFVLFEDKREVELAYSGHVKPLFRAMGSQRWWVG